LLDGDARLLMEREKSQAFDVLILDAFNSGSIPVHLLTREAFEIWMKHLTSDGVLVVQATNRFMDLRPVLSQAAAILGMTARFYVERIGRADSAASGRRGSDWCVLSRDGTFFANT
jgi:spermidine synthase